MEVRPNLEADPGPGLPELGIGVVYSAGLEPLLERFPENIDVIESRATNHVARKPIGQKKS